ncbi:zinc finger CCCH domain-containing protein 3 isoform X2 [Cinnamomum micranthum f. kanehirae]|uniref:Zinc finger CCCH domain-containing protein 3 isoform X2 n=1 Tax=Cinnamomum micranthum f. kanehirae TaxID=337451 RepID=A0A3S3NG82_9MAGN|nr:zinc finger CCCH domain-containing protein 3 isoform X2 [Cinnamomum micranthum f. kanehirae]
MPLGKYYCDYCDKQFQDTPSARRRHLQGIQHQRAKALWYDSFNLNGNLSTSLLSLAFPQTLGVHISPQEIYCSLNGVFLLFASSDQQRLQAHALGKGVCNHFVRTGFCQYGDSCKYFHPKPNTQIPTQAIPGNVARDSVGISLGNLPPSLRPPPEGGYLPLPFVDWG